MSDITLPEGVKINLDKQALTITHDRDLPKSFISQCHKLAGEAGATIRFVRTR